MTFNEAQTRALHIDPQLRAAGWKLNDRTQVRLEVPVDGYDAEPWNGVTDYCLYDASGNVLALVEAKRCSRNAREADEQLRHYVTEIAKKQPFAPFGFMANGHDVWFWEVGLANPRLVAGFFATTDLERLKFLRQNRRPLEATPINSSIVEYVAAGIPVWTMNNVGANEFVEDRCLYITPQKFEELAAYDAQNGDILISRAGTVGRMAIVRTTHPRSIIHSNIIRLSLNGAKILPIYFVALMTWFAPRVARLKRGQEDAYTFMSTGSVGELQIPLPPLPLQRKFAALVERVDHLRAVQREALRQAEHLFDSLLHRAFSG